MKKFAALTILLAILCAHLATPAQAENWPCWRGPRGDGTCLEQNVPTNWDPAGALWKTELPGKGHASAIIWRDRICTATALTDTKERYEGENHAVDAVFTEESAV